MPDSHDQTAAPSAAVSASTSKEGYLTTPPKIDGMPGGIPYIVGNEAAERFSYYGMVGILATFLTKHLLNADGELEPMDEFRANQWTHNFIVAVYAFPFLGALISDGLLGKYRTILFVSLLYCLGHAAMAMVDVPHITGVDPKVMLFIALSLIAMGAGGIKPCVSAHVGDQFGTRNQHLIPRVFAWFYFSINLGATTSMVLTPILLDREKYAATFGSFAETLSRVGIEPGPSLAFGVPGVLMAVATFVFWLGRNKFVHIPPAGPEFVKECFNKDGRRAAMNLAPLFVLISLFFALFDQSHTSWVHQADKMDRVFFRGTTFEFTPDAAQMQALNPILVLLLIPLFSYVIYPYMGRFMEVTPLQKIVVGMFVTVPSFAIIALAQQRIDAGDTPHVMWQVWAYIVLTTAEIMVSITALEFSYTQAPRKMKSFVMGLYLLFAIALGNFLAGLVNKAFADQSEAGETVQQSAGYFWFFTGAMLAMAVVFLVYAKFYKGVTFIQGETESPEDI